MGNGTSNVARANAFTVYKNGNAVVAEDMAVGGNFEVAGDAEVTGTLRVPARGDLSMGDFTAVP